MHELAIARAVVDIAERHARGRKVVRVEVRVGHLRQVVPDSLRFAFELLTREGALRGAELEIAQVPAAGRCRACGAQSELAELPLACARCGSLDVELTSGEELYVEELEVESGSAIESL
jgi:hydrogenase nickel incorporation protein HypA/HybF